MKTLEVRTKKAVKTLKRRRRRPKCGRPRIRGSTGGYNNSQVSRLGQVALPNCCSSLLITSSLLCPPFHGQVQQNRFITQSKKKKKNQIGHRMDNCVIQVQSKPTNSRILPDPELRRTDKSQILLDLRSYWIHELKF